MIPSVWNQRVKLIYFHLEVIVCFLVGLKYVATFNKLTFIFDQRRFLNTKYEDIIIFIYIYNFVCQNICIMFMSMPRLNIRRKWKHEFWVYISDRKKLNLEWIIVVYCHCHHGDQIQNQNIKRKLHSWFKTQAIFITSSYIEYTVDLTTIADITSSIETWYT